MRKLENYGTVGSAVLDVEDDAPARPKAVSASSIRRALTDPLRPHRELVDDYADDADTEAFLRSSGRNRRIRRGLIPKTRNGWIAFGVGSVVVLLALCAGATVALRYASTNDKFRIASSQSIEIDGNSHLTRAQMLSVFGEDVERNIFHVPLEERRAQLEQMPWVEHATVMRLLPNRLRVHVTERIPVAFVRQGGTIGMIDSTGVLLDIPPDAPGNPSYSFPVLTGIKSSDDPAARAQRMKLYAAFLKDLDSDGKGTSAQLSEIDLSDPEDVKALIPDHNAEVLVHFGDQNFLTRYTKFEQHIEEWRSQYPHLSGVDMRYERQVVLQMPPRDSTVPGGDSGNAPVQAASVVAPARPLALAASTKAPVLKPVVAKVSKPQSITPAPAKTVVAVKHPAPAAKANAKSPTQDAATRKRVEAIKAWMAKREKMRAQYLAGKTAN